MQTEDNLVPGDIFVINSDALTVEKREYQKTAWTKIVRILQLKVKQDINAKMLQLSSLKTLLIMKTNM
jgi:hypothetical protein